MTRFLPLLLATLLCAACGQNQDAPPAPPAPPTAAATSADAPPPPPQPPLRETFDKDPQLSLFPRTGSYRPEESNKEGIGYWASFIDHILRTSGMMANSGVEGSNAWAIRGIKGLDSIAFFSPLAVQPSATYRVSFDFKGEIPKGGSAGIGILEFDQFLWIADQFTEAMVKEHQTATHRGAALTGKQAWKSHSFTFTTSPRAGMIHLVLFRDGAMDREKPVWFDNIAIEEVTAAAPR